MTEATAREPRDDADLRALTDRAKAGDPDAWESLYRRTYPKLYTFARRRLPSDDVADDAVSETMIRALDGIDRFQWTGAGIDGWLFGILRNVLYETYRHQRREPVVELDERRAPVAAPDAEPSLQHERALQGDVVRTAFERLNESEREVLELRVVGELSAEQVGAAMGKKPGAVRTAQSRALNRLRIYLLEGSE